MKKYSIKELAQVTGAQILSGKNSQTESENPCFDGVSIDSRTVRTGECFFAVKGQNFDGHDYIAQAFSKGAACAVISREIPGINTLEHKILLVDDTVKALGDFAQQYRKDSGFKVVAITGSAGKTTTRHMISSVLSEYFKVHQSPKSFNNNIGLPLTILGTANDKQLVVAELGSNHPGEISCLTNIALPDIAVVTNVEPSHLEGFGSLDAITNEKLSISVGLSEQGVLVINADNRQLVEAAQRRGLEFRSFGLFTDADYRVKNIQLSGTGSFFEIDGLKMHLPLPGPGNVANAAAAWAICSQFGLTVQQFADALERITAVSGRSEIMQIGTLTVINDCYNANPASMKNALAILHSLAEAARKQQKESRSVFVCGEMAELAEHSQRLHVELGRDAARWQVDLMVGIGPLAEIAAGSAKEQAGDAIEIKCYKDIKLACNNLHEFLRDYDIILVKGSRAAGLELVVDMLKGIFSPGSSNPVIC